MKNFLIVVGLLSMSVIQAQDFNGLNSDMGNLFMLSNAKT